ncbi:hypothetical protein PO124_05500 [Bacillus licheniformis]|nr:hypothetical protein [Bacillus licheniformis]
MNDHPYVSEEKGSGFGSHRKLDYIPNTSARKLRSNKRCFSQCLSHTRTTPSSLSL